MQKRGERCQQCVLKEEEVVVCMSWPAPNSPQGICSWLFILFLVSSGMPVKAMDLSLKVLFLIEISSIHSLVTVMKWSACREEKVSI